MEIEVQLEMHQNEKMEINNKIINLEEELKYAFQKHEIDDEKIKLLKINLNEIDENNKKITIEKEVNLNLN